MKEVADLSIGNNTFSESSEREMFDVNEKSALLVIANVLLRHRRLEDAVAVYESVRKIDAVNKYAMRALIYLYIEQSRFIDALRLIEVLKKISSSDNDTDSLCGLLESKALWMSGREKDASACFSEYMQRATIEI